MRQKLIRTIFFSYTMCLLEIYTHTYTHIHTHTYTSLREAKPIDSAFLRISIDIFQTISLEYGKIDATITKQKLTMFASYLQRVDYYLKRPIRRAFDYKNLRERRTICKRRCL